MLDLLISEPISPILGTCEVIKFYPPNKVGGRKYDYKIRNLQMDASQGAHVLHGIGIHGSKTIGSNIYVGNQKICSIEELKNMFNTVKPQFEETIY